jgi:hypothetical protein
VPGMSSLKVKSSCCAVKAGEVRIRGVYPLHVLLKRAVSRYET